MALFSAFCKQFTEDQRTPSDTHPLGPRICGTGHSQEHKIADKCHAQQADVQLVLQFQEELRHAVHSQLHRSHSMHQHQDQ
jgi:hypothetical protein